jgi:hypothetical protein
MGLFGLSPNLPHQKIGMTNARAWPKFWQAIVVWFVDIKTSEILAKTHHV